MQLPTDEATREYEFLVMAIAEEMQSEFARSNKVFTGRGYDVPYSIQPTNDDAAKMTIINVDNDKSRWSFMTEIGGGNAFYSNKDWDNPGDDYLITPPLWIEDTSFYIESDGTTLKSGINGQVEISSSSKFDTN